MKEKIVTDRSKEELRKKIQEYMEKVKFTVTTSQKSIEKIDKKDFKKRTMLLNKNWKTSPYMFKTLTLKDYKKLRKLFLGLVKKGKEHDDNERRDLRDKIIKKGPVKKNWAWNKEEEIMAFFITESANITVLENLLSWKAEGWKEVIHITHITPESEKKDIAFDKRIFGIDYLLTHKEDRAPLHLCCRCCYSPHS